jgi:hypothetical protein
MARVTIQADKRATRAWLTRAIVRLRGRPLATLAASLVLIEAIVALVGGRFPVLSALVLVLAPGLALLPLLPERALRTWGAALAAAPALGFAASAVALITISSAGISITGTSARLTVAAIVLIGVLLASEEPAFSASRTELASTAALLAAVGAGIVLQGRVIGGSPVPGNDWAQYVLYANQIHAHGSLLIDNPFWMLGGRPFVQDPGVPALYGAFLGMTNLPAGVLEHGIWLFAVLAVLSTFALLRTFWGPVAGVIGATLWAVLPINHDMLGWHGLANAAALALLPLVLLFVVALLESPLEWKPAAGLALLLVALAAMHRLSLLVCLGALALVAVVALFQHTRWTTLASAARVAAALVVLAPGVVYDLITRQRGFEGVQGYKAYLDTKIDLGLVMRDMTFPFTLAAGLGVLFLLIRARSERRALPLAAMLLATLGLAYSWLVHFPVAYVRMAYFLPVALVPLLAVALSRLPARFAALLSAVVIAAILPLAWPQAHNVRDFYAFASDSSLRGVDVVSSQVRPGDVVVTDRCWSFLATWLVQSPTLSALDPGDILPKSEVRPAQQARAILRGTPNGRRLARRLDARFAMVDPNCADAKGRLGSPPRLGRPVFVSTRLVVLRLPGG